MSITKSYNKHTDTYYAYNTTYVWDEKLQKKVQKKVCIGKYDPVTGEIIPNSRRGRPSKQEASASMDADRMNNAIAAPCFSNQAIQELYDLSTEMNEISLEMKKLSERFSSLEKRLLILQQVISKSSN